MRVRIRHWLFDHPLWNFPDDRPWRRLQKLRIGKIGDRRIGDTPAIFGSVVDWRGKSERQERHEISAARERGTNHGKLGCGCLVEQADIRGCRLLDNRRSLLVTARPQRKRNMVEPG